MKKIRCILIVLNILFCHCLLADDQLYQLMSEASEKAFHDDFESALEDSRNMQKLFPHHPAGFFYEMAIIEKIQTDYSTDIWEKKFHKIYKKSLSLAKKYKQDKPKDVDSYFFLGAIQGYYCIHYYRVESRISVFVDAIKAISNFKKAYKINPNLWDVYYGMGNYHYWKAAKAPFLLIGKSRKKLKKRGLEEIQIAAEKGHFCRAEAQGAYVRMLKNEKRYEDALGIINDSLLKYPDSFYLYKFKTDVLIKLKLYDELIKTCNIGLRLLEKKTYAGVDAVIMMWFLKGFGYYQNAQYELAEKELKDFRVYAKKNLDHIKLYYDFYQKSGYLLKKIKKKLKKTEKASQ